jgi:hypothetical protein
MFPFGHCPHGGSDRLAILLLLGRFELRQFALLRMGFKIRIA